jgi:predicted 2-oxoglutarate/Fe(II)-dependent dioxygenase YbiX
MQVTLNVCLGDKFDGGILHFWGLRGEHVGGNKLLGEYQPEVGRAVIHSGRHLHEVTPITAGDRFALIQWTRSWKSARRETCPCCWLNRRRDSDSEKGNSCICGPRWN